MWLLFFVIVCSSSLLIWCFGKAVLRDCGFAWISSRICMAARCEAFSCLVFSYLVDLLGPVWNFDQLDGEERAGHFGLNHFLLRCVCLCFGFTVQSTQWGHRARSVYLTTRLLGRLNPLSGFTSIVHIISPETDN